MSSKAGAASDAAPASGHSGRLSISPVSGLQVKMVTGDQLLIAKETARQLGMGTNILTTEALLEVGLATNQLCLGTTVHHWHADSHAHVLRSSWLNGFLCGGKVWQNPSTEIEHEGQGSASSICLAGRGSMVEPQQQEVVCRTRTAEATHMSTAQT